MTEMVRVGGSMLWFGVALDEAGGERRGAKDVVRARKVSMVWGASWEGHFHVVGAEEVYEKGGTIKVGRGE